MSEKKKLIRAAFRSAVFSRDQHKCRVCGAAPPEVVLDAHHVTDRNDLPNGGYVVENGISVCGPCHEKAEDYHRGLPPESLDPKFSAEELYRLIGSSYEKALKASQKLG